ncbi:MAG: TIGR00268 family protein [Spirochaetae bacterium HGW-Spirochaetae-5]|nr:MAG: TIGR00268 family protein [Spirochaetae bacterium HGW-Spirochaetae-5]
MITDEEINSAELTAASLNIKHRILDLDILSYSNVRENSTERCYHCKTVILKEIIKTAAEEGITTILEGSHSGDMNDYRPGMKAIDELGVISPLKSAGFDKKNIYELSAFLKLPTSEKESYPCLATRIPYGTPLTAELMKRADTAEKIIASFGFRQIRARLHGDILRIEISEEMIPEIASHLVRKKVFAELNKAGFKYITLDLLGYRTGSMNIVKEEPR